MANEFMETFLITISFLQKILDSDQVNFCDAKKLYSSIVTLQLNDNIKYDEKLMKILKECDEPTLKKLWLEVFKGKRNNCLDIFRNEIISRNFCNNLWCQEVYNFTTTQNEKIGINLAEKSGVYINTYSSL